MNKLVNTDSYTEVVKINFTHPRDELEEEQLV